MEVHLAASLFPPHCNLLSELANNTVHFNKSNYALKDICNAEELGISCHTNKKLFPQNWEKTALEVLFDILIIPHILHSRQVLLRLGNKVHCCQHTEAKQLTEIL